MEWNSEINIQDKFIGAAKKTINPILKKNIDELQDLCQTCIDSMELYF